MHSRTRSFSQRLWLIVVAALALAAFAAGCGGDDEETASGGSADEAETFKIGFIASQTGWLAQFEETFIKGLDVAVKEANANGGLAGKHKIELMIKDGKSDPAEGAIAAQSLIAENPSFLIVPCDQDMALPAAQAGQAAGIPTMSSCAAASGFPKLVGDLMTLNNPGTFAEGSALAEFALKKGWRTAYVVSTKDAAVFQTSGDAFSTMFEKGGGKVIGSDNYKLGEPRFTAQTTKIANLDPQPDVIMLSTNTPETPIMLKELQAQGVTTPVLSLFGNHTELMFQAGSALDQIPTYITAIAFAEPNTPMAEFYDSYAEAWGEIPDTEFAALAADVVDLLDYAVKTAGSTEPNAIDNAIDEAKDVQVTTGKATYAGQGGVPKKGYFILQALPEEFEKVDQFYPEEVYQPAR